MEAMHWAQMNCPLNEEMTPGFGLYCSSAPPPDYVLEPDCTCTVYHPTTLDDRPGIAIDLATRESIMAFIEQHDVTSSGNVTELSHENFTRLLLAPTVLAVVRRDHNIIGTMFSLPLRLKHDKKNMLSSYTTFLCVAQSQRTSGLAMVLIRAVMKFGYEWYGINHGYYMTPEVHHPIHNLVKSWYRPINLKRSREAGFALQPFATVDHERRAYHIGTPKLIPIKASAREYELVLTLLRTHELRLAPTHYEWSQLCDCFDIYIVPNRGLFMLFPLSVYVAETGKKVRIAQLALMVGEVLVQALFVAGRDKYDLLYGRYVGDVTVSRVAQIRGQTTVSNEYLEFYNTRTIIPNDQLALPIF